MVRPRHDRTKPKLKRSELRQARKAAEAERKKVKQKGGGDGATRKRDWWEPDEEA